jgi:hypothetical protein
MGGAADNATFGWGVPDEHADKRPANAASKPSRANDTVFARTDNPLAAIRKRHPEAARHDTNKYRLLWR